MRVMILVPDLPVSLESIKGGVQAAVLNILKGFKNFEIDILVLSFSNEVLDERYFQFSNNIKIVYCPSGNLPLSFLNYIVNCPGYINKYIKLYNPDIIHYEIGNAFLLTRLFFYTKKKVILTVHGITTAEARIKTKLKDKITWYFNALIDRILRPKKIIHISEYSRRIITKRIDSNQSIIYNAISDKFIDIPLKNKTDNRLLYVGVINDRKNLLLLLKSIQELRLQNIIYHLDVVGDYLKGEDYYEVIESFIKENNLMDFVHFHGWKSQEELIDFLASADIFVLPSRQETLPISVAEAMAAGKVVIASSVGGIPEMIEKDQTGFLIDPNSVTELSSILKSLYSNFSAISRIAQPAKIDASEKYAGQIIARKTLEYYERLLF